MIGQIREHIKLSIKKCNPDFRPTDKPFFNDQDLAGTQIDYTYHVEMSTALFELQQLDGVITNIPVNVKVYRQGGREKNQVFDEGYTQALCIAALIIDNTELTSASYIKSVDVESVTPSEVPESEDVYVYEMGFVFKLAYA